MRMIFLILILLRATSVHAHSTGLGVIILGFVGGKLFISAAISGFVISLLLPRPSTPIGTWAKIGLVALACQIPWMPQIMGDWSWQVTLSTVRGNLGELSGLLQLANWVLLAATSAFWAIAVYQKESKRFRWIGGGILLILFFHPVIRGTPASFWTQELLSLGDFSSWSLSPEERSKVLANLKEKEVSSQNSFEKYRAIQAQMGLGEKPDAILPKALAMAESADRGAAYQGFSLLGDLGEIAVPEIYKRVLEVRPLEERKKFVRALGQIVGGGGGSPPGGSIPATNALLDIAQNVNLETDLRLGALDALGAKGSLQNLYWDMNESYYAGVADRLLHLSNEDDPISSKAIEVMGMERLSYCGPILVPQLMNKLASTAPGPFQLKIEETLNAIKEREARKKILKGK